ncbi:hypothetical protein GYMLUDRAFT_246219 [Collybiopsis luxurians FD-317 M1]|uniref:Clp1-like protein n=1 Tax=Collybiopsis luxurians FD-317 M1 TaxID=944289 RepID=A0A0D0B4G3_9AGAR|nr:hypothetical protein GYMLUDRAFT_246219 [Collybiopsis luxurians FD-317 M1]
MPRALRPRNFSIRPTENTPPVKAVAKHSRTRKNRKTLSSAKFDAERARKKAQKNAPVRLNVVVYGNGTENADVEMQDTPGSSAPRPPKVVPVVLPRAFLQPPVCEPSAEAIAAATGAPYNGQTAAFVRDNLESLGSRSLKTACSVTAQVDNSVLPKELDVVVNDLTATNYPTHMLAVYAPVPKKPENVSSWVPPKTDIKLYPVHAIFMAAHCAKLGPFSPSSTTTTEFTPTSTPRKVTLPVRPLCLPSPSTFPTLLRYFYLRSQDALFEAFLPSIPPLEFMENCTSEEQMYALAKRIGETFTPTTLLKYAKTIQGVWQNACALGIFDDGLWNAIDSCYEVILSALAIGTGNPRAVFVSKAPTPVKP